MAEEIVIKAQPRTVIGKQVKALRRQGGLPAVLYGTHIQQPIPVTLEAREANRLLSGISSSHLVLIDINGEQHNALVSEKQRNYLTGELLHVDFHVVSMTEKLRTMVGVALHGESLAVQHQIGVLVTGVEQVEVEALPRDLPNVFMVDISGLKEVGDSVYVRDLQVPAGVELLTHADEMIALITGLAAEEVAEQAEAAGEEPEVIERSKREEE